MQPTTTRRFAILMSGRQCQTWIARCLEALLKVEGAEPVALIKPDKTGIRKRRRPARGGKLFKTWMRLEERVRPRASMVRCDLPDGVRSLPTLTCAFERHDSYAYRFSEADVERLRSLDLDFIVAFLGFDILRGDVLNVPRFGVWSYHHGDWRKYRGLPPGFWELHAGDDRTGAVLQRLTDKLDSGVVLRRGDFPTRTTSCNANYDNVFLGCVPWMADTCAALCSGDESRFTAEPAVATAPIRHAPGNAQTARVIGNLATEHVRRSLSRAIRISPAHSA